MRRVSGGGGPDMRTARVTTGSVAASGVATVVVVFAEPFTDTNYTVAATVHEGTSADTLRVGKVASIAADRVTVRVNNQDTLNARTGTLHVIAIHD